MCKVREVSKLYEDYKSAERAYKAAMEEIKELLLSTGDTELVSEDGSKVVKLIHQAEVSMPAYTKKAYDYVRLY